MVEDASPAQRKLSFRPDIEGLRGIAVLLVVAYHTGIVAFRGGFLGVDVFFVLSGYLITGLLVQEVNKSGRISFSKFYARRVRRLLPASVLTVSAILVVGALVLSPLELLTVARTARATALYASNLWFVLKSANYFAPDVATNPLLHTWSLAVEEQFYILWPALVWLGFCRSRSRRNLAVLVGAVSLLSFVLCVWLTRWKGPWAFFGSPARAWEFGFGGLAALYFREPGDARSRYFWRAMGWLGLALVLIASALFFSDMAFPGYAAALPVAGTVLALVAGARAPGEGIALVTNTPVLQYIGSVSYSWYLWHWPALVFLTVVYPRSPFWFRIIASAAALGLAALTKVLVEDPARYNGWLVRRPGWSIALGILLTVTAALTANYERGSAARAMLTPQQVRTTNAADSENLPRPNCLVAMGDPKVTECIAGDVNSSRSVILFGDSKAAQWFPALDVIARQHGWKLVSMVKAACPAANVDVFNPQLRRHEFECNQWREAALRRIKQISPLLLVMSNSVGYVKALDRTDGYAQLNASQWQIAVRDTLAVLSSDRIPVVLIRDSPRELVASPVCISRAEAHSWYPMANCRTQARQALDQGVLNSEVAAVSVFPHMEYVDFSPILCPNGICEAVLNSMIVYQDRHHLTSALSRSLSPELDQTISRLLR